MNEYAVEIHILDSDTGEWVIKEPNYMVEAYDDADAHSKTNRYASNHYNNWRIENIRLIKKFANPDGEI